MCWGRHTCHLGAEFVLRHHFHKRSHDLAKVSKPGWPRFGFPLMYQTDVLEILGILTATAAMEFRREGAVRADGRSPLPGRTTGRRTRPAIPGAEP